MTAERMIFLHPSDELYGADRILLELVAALDPAIEVQVWLPTDLAHPEAALCTELTARGVTVRHLDLPILRRAYRTPAALARLALKTAQLVRQLRAARPTTVYCTSSASFLGVPAARLARVRRVIGHVQEIWSDSDRKVLGTPARGCHSIFAISNAVRDSLPPALAGRTTVITNATPEPAEMIDIETHSGPLRFVIASRWNGWKGHPTLLAAWDQLDSPGELVVLGGPPASGLSVDVRALVAGLRHPESVTIIGEVPDPAPYLRDADVILMPSDQPEPFGLVAIEAFARGRPVIASAAGGLLDIVSDGDNGWLFPPMDVDGLAAVLGKLTRADVTAAGHRARETYQARYTTERYAADWNAALAAS